MAEHSLEEWFLALIMVGGPVALISWLVDLYWTQREEQKQQ